MRVLTIQRACAAGQSSSGPCGGSECESLRRRRPFPSRDGPRAASFIPAGPGARSRPSWRVLECGREWGASGPSEGRHVGVRPTADHHRARGDDMTDPAASDGGSSSDPAPGPIAKTCDASGMAEIHRYFRAGFGEAPALVRGVRAGDARHTEAVARQLEVLSLALHAHHEGEDQRLWSALEQRAPACALHVERMKTQHQAMLAPLRDLDAALPAWRASATRCERRGRARVPSTASMRHWRSTSATRRRTSCRSWRPCSPRQRSTGSPSTAARPPPRGRPGPSLGAIMAAQPDGGAAFAKQNLPAPVRLLWRVVGRRKYDAHRAALTAQR